MISVRNLTKRYAGHTAVDDISFEVDRGEIVGFLGPNGAGKSTTMRILTCYLSATQGAASVGGFDTFKDSIEVRKRIGYMPENVPLYDDMRVKEYLHFRAQLKGLRGRSAKRAAGEAMDTCSLQDVRRKMIGTLSKGYRQRVGLADALVNKPDLLILDEPTNGLDPNQIRQVRELIKHLGERHTILISTHILSEVEMTATRVIIIDKGKIKASDTPQNLIRRLHSSGTVHLELKAKGEQAVKKIETLSDVKNAVHTGTNQGWAMIDVHAFSSVDIREQLFDLAREQNWPLRELYRDTASLEDAFVNITRS